MKKVKLWNALIFFKPTAVLFFSILLSACTPPPPIGPLPGKTPDSFRIAFGSCNKTFLPQPLWNPIRTAQPDLWMWLGDIVYGDRGGIDTIRWMYNFQKKHPDYAALRQTVPVIGIWDDHDYGVNDGGSEYEHKKETQRLLMDFLDEPAESPRRLQEGIYTSYRYDKLNTRIKLILLDERSFREEPRANKDILGDKQWQWLYGELFGDTTDITLIASSSQIIPNDNYAFNEVWQDYPASRDKMLSWLKTVPGTVLIVSGDRHYAEISQIENGRNNGRSTLTELTSSGLTHTKNYTLYSLLPIEPNSHRVGDFYGGLNFGVIDIDAVQRKIFGYVCDHESMIRLQLVIDY